MNRVRQASISLFAVAVGVGCLQRDTASAQGGIGSGTRVCSVVTSDKWRDTIAVTENWQSGWCGEYMKLVKADKFFLGCIDDHGVHFSGPGATEWPTCGAGGGVRRTTRLCSVVTSEKWRDTIDVPDGWLGNDCQSYMRLVKADKFFLGCVDDLGVFFGDEGIQEWPQRCIAKKPCGETSPPQCGGDCPEQSDVCVFNDALGVCACRVTE